MEKVKKEFQAVIKAIRQEMETESQYPKPMMTAAQIEKKTATVNCGGEWKQNDKGWALNLAKTVMQDERFIEYLAKYEGRAHIEEDSFGVAQVRINF